VIAGAIIACVQWGQTLTLNGCLHPLSVRVWPHWVE